MDKAGGQEGAGQSRGASGCRAGPGCIRCAKEDGGVCSLVSGVEVREQREAVGNSRPPWLTSRIEGGTRGGPAWIWRLLESRVDTTSRWLESMMGRGVSTQHLPGWWPERWGKCGGRGSLGMGAL